MKKIIISFSALIVMALIFGCASDIILEPPETLEGNYVGQYIYRERGTGITEDTIIQQITWIFSEDSWNLFINPEHPDFNTDFCLCEAFGQYLLEDRLRLQVNQSQPKSFVVDGEENCSSCNQSFVPDGLFLLDRSTDTLVMTQQVTTSDQTIVKELRLLKVFDTK